MSEDEFEPGLRRPNYNINVNAAIQKIIDETVSERSDMDYFDIIVVIILCFGLGYFYLFVLVKLGFGSIH